MTWFDSYEMKWILRTELPLSATKSHSASNFGIKLSSPILVNLLLGTDQLMGRPPPPVVQEERRVRLADTPVTGSPWNPKTLFLKFRHSLSPSLFAPVGSTPKLRSDPKFENQFGLLIHRFAIVRAFSNPSLH